jgi:hypothetical protein
VIALLAGVTGLISQILYYKPGRLPDASVFFTAAAYVVLIAVAVAALLRIHRLVLVGFLQGIWWVAVTYLAGDIAEASVYHLAGGARAIAGYFVGTLSDVLGIIAAILLMVSWAPAADRGRASGLRALPVMLLCGVGLSQIAELIFYGNVFRYDTYGFVTSAQHSTAIIVGLAVTWYAVSLRARTLGGALVLGWATITAMFLLADTTAFWSHAPSYVPYGAGSQYTTRTWSVLGCVLLAIVVILTVIYMRRPSDPEPSHLEE